ncbi:FecCD family ABC transporter permease [Embleya sp. NPDC020886]|uniref:FecCD family ABC transporter permease n=1 Tax=Embleya sp. NPDC020886 TaxID=3363980 RepID=UPI0037BDD08B
MNVLPTRGRPTERRVLYLVSALFVLAAACLLSLAVGSRTIAPGAVLDALVHGGDSTDAIVVDSMRLPRTVVALLVGASLGVAGACMQGLTRNPIAEPGILGISNGAAAGVVTAISVFGVTSLTGYVWFGFAGALCTGVLVYAVAARGRGGATPVKLALSGQALAATLGALITLVLTTDQGTLDQYRFWLVGSLSGRTDEVAWRMLPFVGVGMLLVAGTARGLDALALGDDVAKGLGHKVNRIRVIGGLGATVLTGVAVAATGPISFVGLAVPHAARALVGSDHRWVLAMSALLAPILLLVADVLGRIIFPPAEVEVGAMTALIGVPILVVLVRRKPVVSG